MQNTDLQVGEHIFSWNPIRMLSSSSFYVQHFFNEIKVDPEEHADRNLHD